MLKLLSKLKGFLRALLSFCFVVLIINFFDIVLELNYVTYFYNSFVLIEFCYLVVVWSMYLNCLLYLYWLYFYYYIIVLRPRKFNQSVKFSWFEFIIFFFLATLWTLLMLFVNLFILEQLGFFC